ncbi:MAG: hypothetical protein IH996_07815 [Proteobacteria bacterium]|nr:hypothetical protein [Pseudomonadota bacterium]
MNRALSKVVLIPLVAVGLTACQEKQAASGLEGLPTGSVQTGPNMYMIPTGQPDGDGCQAYRVHSPGNVVVQMVYFRKADGDFTANKKEAACLAAAPQS